MEQQEQEQEESKTVSEQQECPICGFQTMTNITTCHLRCRNCGSEMDCSDKGLTW